MKILVIRGCIECRHFQRHTTQTKFCHHPSIKNGESFGWREIPNGMAFPEWCPLEDAPKEG